MGLAAFLLGFCTAAPTSGQHDFSIEPLLASGISEQDVLMRGRYARQWRTPDETLVVMFNGGFELEMGRRQLAANDAVVWIAPRVRPGDNRKYFDLTVYLSENARVVEPGGTIVVDNILLVRNLRTLGRIIKQHDAHAPQDMSASPLYQDALQARDADRPSTREEAQPTPPDEPPPEIAPEIERPAAQDGELPQVVRPDEARIAQEEQPPRTVRYRAQRIEPAQTPAGENAYVGLGGVYFSQAGGPNAPMLEIRADTAVIFAPGDAMGPLLGETGVAEEPTDADGDSDAPLSDDDEPPPPTIWERTQPPPSEAAAPEAAGTLGMPGPAGGVQAVYLEGDVVLSLGTRFVRAERLYYDFHRNRALILDAVFRTEIPDREIPLYVRANEIRQLSAREFSAEQAIVTTSEFYTPHYHVGAERIYIRDLTDRDASGRAVTQVAGEYEMGNATLNVGGWPILWWPHSRGRLETSETLLRRFRTGYSGDFGAEVETDWYLFNLLGVQAPPGYDATLRLDYFSERGPATGIDLDYEREDHFGLVRSYYIHDDGEDSLGPLRRDDEDPSTSNRGRFLWRHRHYLSHDWEVTLEMSYISDPYFLEEYEKSEWFEGKDQETVVYFKRATGNQALTLLANWRILDFVTETEHLPELAYRRIGDTFLDPVILYHESRAGMVRYRRDDRHFIDNPLFTNDTPSDVTYRSDLRQEAELPIKLGALNVVPFATFRGTWWDGQPLDDGGLWRGMGIYGVRGGTSFSRVYDRINSDLLDIHRIRHVIQPDFAAWFANSTARSEELYPFDYGIETIDGFYGATGGVRQVWQTKRGAPGSRETIDLLSLDLEVGFFGNTDGREDISNGFANPLRPENSRTRNYFAGQSIYRLGDTTSLLYDFNIDLNDWSYDRHAVALAVERSPRLAYVLGTRYAGDIDMNLIGGGWNYRINPKHVYTVRTWWDADTGELGEVAVAYVRKVPRWYFGLTFEYDNVDDDFTISLSVWPEGIPEWTLGSRRFTGLATSTGIRP